MTSGGKASSWSKMRMSSFRTRQFGFAARRSKLSMATSRRRTPAASAVILPMGTVLGVHRENPLGKRCEPKASDELRTASALQSASGIDAAKSGVRLTNQGRGTGSSRSPASKTASISIASDVTARSHPPDSFTTISWGESASASAIRIAGHVFPFVSRRAKISASMRWIT